MSYLTHGTRRPKRSVIAGRTIAGLLFVVGPYVVVLYLVYEWLT